MNEILSKFPKEDFYVVFGTSHSAGWCKDDNQIIMPNEKNWTKQFEKLSGVPVLNLAVGGCTAYEMQNMVIDFLYYYKHQPNKCIGAFIEARQSEFFVWIDKKDDINFNKVNLVPDILSGREYTDSSKHTDFLHSVADKENAIHYNKQGDLKDWLNGFIEHQLGGMYNYYDSLYVLYKMTQMLNTYDIKNYSFYWASSDYNDNPDSDYNTDSAQKLVEISEQMDINFIKFDPESEDNFFHNNSAIKAVQQIKGNTWIENNTCSCYHQNEHFHKELAQIINKVIYNDG